MDLNVELSFVGPDGATDDGFERFLEAVLDELDKIGRDDVEVTASLAKRTAIFTVFEGDAEPSVDKLLSDARTALHAANCNTKGWETATTRLVGETPTKPLIDV